MQKSVSVQGRPPADSPDPLHQALMTLINDPANRPGDRLPTERALAQRFGVSRGTIRTALARLEDRGHIVRIVGSGTYIAERNIEAGPTATEDPMGRPPSSPPAKTSAGIIREDPAQASATPRPPRDASPQEILEARALVEPLLPALVVSRANAADLSRIRAALEGAEQAATQEEFEQWDGRFHQAIAAATHNILIMEIYQMITAARDLAQWGEMRRRNATPQRRAEREAEHAAIYDALQARDAARARIALGEHLGKVKDNLLG